MTNTSDHFDECPACGRPNEHPFFFCEGCGATRARLGRWTTTANLTLAMSTFLGYFYFRGEYFAWAWPLFILYSILFVQFSLFLVRGHWAYVARFMIWFAVFLPGCGLIIHSLSGRGGEEAPMVFLAPSALMDLLTDRDWYWVTYPALAAIVVAVFLPCYFRWGRIYGWTNAYRIVLMSFLAIAVVAMLAFEAVEWIHNHDLFPQLTKDLEDMIYVKPQYDGILSIFAVTTFRIMAFEILAFSAVKGYAATRAVARPRPSPGLQRESGFTRAVYHIVQILRRFALTIENMMRSTLRILIGLSLSLWKVLLAFMRELFLPTVAMLASAGLLFALARLTDMYVAPSPKAGLAGAGAAMAPASFWSDFADATRWILALNILAVLAGLVFFDMVFIGCKTPYRWKRIMAFYGELLGWLLPNLLVFFLVLSVSLFGSSATINHFEAGGHALPFRMGLLTKIVFTLLVVLIGAIVIRKRTLFLEPAMAEAIGDDDDGESVAVQAGGAGAREAPSSQSTPSSSSIPSSVQPTADLTPIEENAAREGAADEAKAAAAAVEEPAADLTPGQAIKTRKAAASRLAGIIDRSVFRAGAKIVGQDTAERMADAAREWKERLTGKPAIVSELAAANVRHREKTAQIKALEATQGALSPTTYANLHTHYTGELEAIAISRIELQAKVETLRAEQMVEKTRIETELADLRRQESELTAVLQAGAINRKDYGLTMRELQRSIYAASATLNKCRRILDFIEAETSRATAPPNAQ